VRKRAPAEHVPTAIVAERDHDQFGAFQDALHLETEELVPALAEGDRGVVAFLVDHAVNASPEHLVGDANEPPRLHQPDARRGVRRVEQPGENVVGDHGAGHEPAHVASFGDDPVHGPSLVRAECMLVHAGQRTFVGMRAEVLVTATELDRLIASGSPLSILDVRWQLAGPDGRADYERGHIPGAVYASLEDDLSDHGVIGRGRHPLPSGDALQDAARGWGIRAGVPVVVYDDWNRAGSARAWWVLRAAGIDDVRILDGGLGAWTGPLETGSVIPQPGDVTVAHPDLYAGALPTLTADEAAALGARLLDARAPERFRGEVEPVDPVAGHVPGATNVPSTSLLDADGLFLPDVALREALGTPAGAYCGSGVTASVVLAALAAVGVDAALFPGSWSQWSGEPGRPIATG
jgi:thiosulfate/3-mercaptopyruvate sulfurtransferase